MKNLRHFVLSCSALVVGMGFLSANVFAENVSEDLKAEDASVAHNTHRAAKSIEHHTHHATKSVLHETHHATKKALHETHHGLKKGTHAVSGTVAKASHDVADFVEGDKAKNDASK